MTAAGDGRGHHWSAVLERLTSVWRAVGITVMWLIACVPMITAGAATVALVAVVRDEILRQERPVARSYLAYLRENLKVGTGLLGLSVAPVAALLMVWQLPASPFTTAWGTITVGGTVAALPLLVHGYPMAAHAAHDSLRGLYRACVLITLARPGATVVGLLVIAAGAAAALVWPGSLLLLAYPIARTLFVSFRRAFDAVATGRMNAIAGPEERVHVG